MLGTLLIATLSLVPGDVGNPSESNSIALGELRVEPDEHMKGRSRSEVICRIGHPCEIIKMRDGSEIWWYQQDGNIVVFERGQAVYVGTEEKESTGVVSNPMLQGN